MDLNSSVTGGSIKLISFAHTLLFFRPIMDDINDEPVNGFIHILLKYKPEASDIIVLTSYFSIGYSLKALLIFTKC